MSLRESSGDTLFGFVPCNRRQSIISIAFIIIILNLLCLCFLASKIVNRFGRKYSQWIFPSFGDPEKPVSKSTAYHRHKAFLRANDLPNIRFHDLRHTFATHAIRNGVDAKTLSGILGHTNASFTLDTYTHVTGDMQRRAAEIVGGFMEEIFGKELKPWLTDEKKEQEH